MADKMTIQFEDGKKIIRHSSGLVMEYTKEALELIKQELLERKQGVEEEIASIDADLVNLEKSKKL